MAIEVPEWHLPSGVTARFTTRDSGHSLAPWESFNLGSHVGDAPAAVAANRAGLLSALPAGSRLRWLTQVHGARVIQDNEEAAAPADAIVSRRPGAVCAVLTADCLPILLCADDGSVVGAAHAGWRGMAAGVIEAAVAAMSHPPQRILAWLGPAIGPAAFEVGPEVRAALTGGPVRAGAELDSCFRAGRGDRCHVDIHALAALRLKACGVTEFAFDQRCTVASPELFFSYRRDGETGRMASLILINE